MIQFSANTLDGLIPVIEAIHQHKSKYPVILLKGAMGSGKTTLIREYCNFVNVDNNVSSPTFTIINEYKTANSEIIYHADLYRIQKPAELLDTGILDYLFSSNLFFIEWPELLEPYIDVPYMELFINTEDYIQREYQIVFHE